MNMNDDQRIVNQLKEDLSKKSIEELIYLNFNPTGYVEESTKNLRDQNERLLNEVNSLNSDYQSCLSQYGDVKSFVDKYQSEVQEKENELRQLRQQKKAIDSSMTLESLKKELKNHIDSKYGKPRQKLMNDLFSKKIEFDKFLEEFKELSENYHYYSIIRDKLNLCH